MSAICRFGLAVLRDIWTRYLSLHKACRGSVATEYGLIAAMIVVVIIVALTQVRTNLLSLPFPSLLAAFTAALTS